MNMPNIQWLDWPAPKAVKACYSLRTSGVSTPPYDSFNMGHHVGDDPTSVFSNRQQLSEAIQQDHILWLHQVHGTRVLCADTIQPDDFLDADGSYASTPNQVCCVMTADCLPVFFCDNNGTQVAVAHAGWRGLLDGVLQNTIATFDPSSSLMAYLGPAIGPQAFEVGDEVRAAFIEVSSPLGKHFIASSQPSKWMADIYGLARDILRMNNVLEIYGGTRCTLTEPDAFFSYRRDGVTGRMAHLIWLESAD